MTPDKILKRVVLDRLDWVDRMISEIQSLPLQDRDAFLADSRNVWTAESCLRRTLEALLDLGRHILAKGFATGVTTYKEIAKELEMHQVMTMETAVLLKIMAGYRNRMVHFYYEITPDELYEICSTQLNDLIQIRQAYTRWLRANASYLDDQL
ncbi:MAG: DUF86 domain-containing protein [Chloroflexi bacterium]|nr:MAG: DUF86 domain-containing protein [Chloroflexota bacterium]